MANTKRRGRMSNLEKTLNEVLNNLDEIKEIDEKIKTLQEERERVFNQRKADIEKIFPVIYKACQEQIKSSKDDIEYTTEIVEEPEVKEEKIVDDQQEDQINEQTVDKLEAIPEVSSEEEFKLSSEYGKENCETRESDIVNYLSYSKIVPKRKIGYQDSEVMNFLEATIEFPTSSEPEIRQELEKQIIFLGRPAMSVQLNGTARSLLIHMINGNCDIDAEGYAFSNGLSEEQFVASVKIAQNAMAVATNGVVELQWYASSGNSDYVQFRDLRLRLAIVKKVWTVYNKRAVRNEYIKHIEMLEK